MYLNEKVINQATKQKTIILISRDHLSKPSAIFEPNICLQVH